MNIQRVESWVWLLIYGGMGLLGLGLSVQSTNATMGWSMVALGGAGALIGVVLIWVRSRMRDDA